MPRAIRFHLDESCATALARGLRRRGIDATMSGEVSLIGAADDRQLAHATSEGRVLVTHDPDFFALHDPGIEHADIIFIRQRRGAIGPMVNNLTLTWQAPEPPEMRNRLEYF